MVRYSTRHTKAGRLLGGFCLKYTYYPGPYVVSGVRTSPPFLGGFPKSKVGRFKDCIVSR